MQTRFHQEIEFRNLLHRLFHQRSLARLQRDHKRQMRLVVAGLLQDRVQVDAAAREDRRQRSNNSRTVFHCEADVVAARKVRIYARCEFGIFRKGRRHTRSGAGDGDQSRKPRQPPWDVLRPRARRIRFRRQTCPSTSRGSGCLPRAPEREASPTNDGCTAAINESPCNCAHETCRMVHCNCLAWSKSTASMGEIERVTILVG